jgi:WD40 repeat protein/tetratricopeptide (TPR) repeat protein/serine/threonine protein kinase
MTGPQPELLALFREALGREAPDERAAYLDQACRGRPELRAQVEALLRAHREAGGPPPEPPGRQPATVDEVPAADGGEGPGAVIGPYKLLQLIGEGGMGAVFMAEQTHPVRRKVALKVIKPGMDTRHVIARFEAERQALALMDHPNIARVFDAGETGSGRPYFVMELVRGIPITDYCDRNHLTPRERLGLFVAVCQAVQHAHQKGIIHRDVKPSNVLVTLHDGTPVPKVIDFGIAKATGAQLTEKTLFTNFGEMVGTPMYMSPEQAEMSGLDVDTRTDVYSLGVLLYELLTGTTPFDRERLKRASYDEIRRIIREEEPPRPSARISTLGQSATAVSASRKSDPRRLRQLFRGELDWIVMKCLEKDRNRRYETANGLARDLERYLVDEPVQACPPSAAYRLRKFARRHRVALTTAALVGVALVVGTVVSAWQAFLALDAQALAQKRLETANANFIDARKQEQRALDNAKEAKDQQKAAEDQERTAQRRLHAAHMNLAQQAWEKGQAGRMLELLEGQRPLPGREDPRAFEWYHLWWLCHRGHRFTLRHRAPANAVAYSPDGTTLACGYADGAVKLWDAATGQARVGLPGHSQGVSGVAFSPDGGTLASGDFAGAIKLWDVATGRQRATLSGHKYRISCVAFSPDGQTLASGGGVEHEGAELRLWDVVKREVRASLPVKSAVYTLAFSPDGKKLASAGYFEPVKLWDLATGQVQFSREHAWRHLCVAFSPDGKSLASGGSTDQAIELCDTATGKKQATLTGHTRSVNSIAFSPDGKWLASGGDDGTVKLWEPGAGPQRAYGHVGPVAAVRFSPDGKTLASASEDGTVKLWDVAVGQKRPAFPQHGGMIWTLAFSPDGKSLAWASGDPTLKLWDVATRGERMAFRGHTHDLAAVAVSPDGRTLASAAHDNMVKLWDVSTGQERLTLRGHTNIVHAVAFSPDGKLVASGANDQTARLWDVATGRERATWALEYWVRAVAISPDGKTVAAATLTGTIKLWDVDTHRERAAARPGGRITALAFSPDGRKLAVLTEGRGVTLRDATTLREQAAIAGSPVSAAANCMAFLGDWKTLAVGSSDGSVKLWDVATGEERATLSGHTDITAVAFSPDGSTLVTGCRDGTVELWHAAAEQDVTAQSRVGDTRELLGRNHLERGNRLLGDGRQQEAEQAFRQTLECYEKLAAQSPADADYRQGVADSLFDLGAFLRSNSRPGEAEQVFRQALGCFDRLAAEFPVDRRYRFSAAACRNNLGTILEEGNRAPEAEQVYRQAVALEEKLLADFPSSSVYRRELARYLRNLARLLAAHNRPEEAKKFQQHLVEVLEGLAGNDPEGYSMRGDAHASQGQWARALADYARAVELQPDEWQYYSRRANAYFQLGQMERAITDLSTALELEPGNAALRHNRGSVRMRLDRWDEAIEDYSRAIELNPDDEDAWNARGVAYASLGQFDKAIANHRKAIELKPDDGVAHDNLGNALAFGGRYGEALAAYRKAVELTPNNSAAHRHLAWLLAACPAPEFRDPGEALRLAKRAAELAPEDGDCRAALGAAHYRAGDWKAAAEALEQSTELNADGNAAVFFFLAMARGRLGNEDRAGLWYAAAARWMHRNESSPDLVRGLRAEAAALLGLPEPPQAAPGAKPDDVELYTLVLAANPEAGWAFIQRGRAHGAAGRWDQAGADHARATRLSPKDPSAWFAYAGALQHQGALAEAIAAYRQALELAPDSHLLHNHLAWLLATCPDPMFRDPGEAVRLAKRAVDRAPGNGDYWNTLGVAHYRAGDRDAALATLATSMELRQGGDAFDFLFLAMAHGKGGAEEEARRWYDRATQWLEKNGKDLEKDPVPQEELRRFRAEAAELLGVRYEWKPAPPGPQVRDRWRREMQRRAEALKVWRMDKGNPVPAELVPGALHRYEDPDRDLHEAALWGWGRTGRPVALAAMEFSPRADGGAHAGYELVSLADGPLRAEGNSGKWRWSPRQPGVVLRPFPEARAPADTEAERLGQMKELAKRLTSFEAFGPDRKPVELRLLEEPLRRYAEPASGLLDGALFVFAHCGNPEIVLLVEARAGGNGGARWHYGAARLTTAELSLRLDGREVWKQPAGSTLTSQDSYWIVSEPYTPR